MRPECPGRLVGHRRVGKHSGVFPQDLLRLPSGDRRKGRIDANDSAGGIADEDPERARLEDSFGEIPLLFGLQPFRHVPADDHEPPAASITVVEGDFPALDDVNGALGSFHHFDRIGHRPVLPRLLVRGLTGQMSAGERGIHSGQILFSLSRPIGSFRPPQKFQRRLVGQEPGPVSIL